MSKERLSQAEAILHEVGYDGETIALVRKTFAKALNLVEEK
jgi:hypothetical protein